MFVYFLSPAAAFSAVLEPYDVKNNADFSLPDLDGKMHTLSDYKGKAVLVTFWASWCLPCLQEMPSMSRLADALNDNNFEIVSINISDKPRRIRETLRRLKLNLLVLQDINSKIYKSWGGRILPTSYVVDHTGDIRYQVIGPMEWDDADVVSKIKQLIQSQ